jgi:two-component system, NtrC family, sensor kinase
MNQVFIADDNNTDRMILESALNQMGFEIDSFVSGSSVYEAIYNARQPTVVLLDWIMPDRTGVEICQALSAHPPAQSVYAILVTSRTEKTDIAYALENGADDYITKPFDAIELKARINVGIRLLNFKQQLFDSNTRFLEYTKRIEELAEARAEQLVRADRLSTIGMLSSGIAHEINNPASFIAVNVQTLEENLTLLSDAFDDTVSNEQKRKASQLISMLPEILTEMKSGVSRIQNIVTGLKAYTHPLSEKFTWFRIDVCIESALRLCVNKLKYHVTVMKKLLETPEVFGDRYQIEQVFVNLFANAADAIEENRKDGILTISSDCLDGYVIVYVRDNGPGIPAENKEKMFMPFFTTKPIGKGTGLGLSISSNIIKNHKGQLTVENHPEGGAQFQISLPAKRKESL